MDQVESLDHLAQAAPNLWFAIMLTVIGMLIYWLMQIKKKQKEKGSSFEMKLWWLNNRLDFWISILAAAGIFAASWQSNSLTMERCLFMGLVVSYFTNKLMQISSL